MKILKPKVRKEAALFAIGSFGLSQRRACALVMVSRTVLGYRSRVNELNERLRIRMKELAIKLRRYGHWRLWVVLRREGFMVNHKRTERIYRQEGLSLGIRRRRKFASVTRIEMPQAIRPNERWSMDFVQDKFWAGGRFRTLTIVDTYTKECPVIEVDTSITGQRVVRVLEHLSEVRGLPEIITVDNGPEFISKALDEWAYRRGVKMDFIRPGKPVENAYIESFNGKFRDECLNENYFINLREAKEIIENWRLQYNTFRPHSALSDLTPEEFSRQCTIKQNTEKHYLPVA